MTAKLKAEGAIAEEELPGERARPTKIWGFLCAPMPGAIMRPVRARSGRAADGVLGSAFRVHGGGLRVVDASVFPRIPGFFIVSAVYMAAEKAADVILAS